MRPSAKLRPRRFTCCELGPEWINEQRGWHSTRDTAFFGQSVIAAPPSCSRHSRVSLPIAPPHGWPLPHQKVDCRCVDRRRRFAFVRWKTVSTLRGGAKVRRVARNMFGLFPFIHTDYFAFEYGATDDTRRAYLMARTWPAIRLPRLQPTCRSRPAGPPHQAARFRPAKPACQAAL